MGIIHLELKEIDKMAFTSAQKSEIVKKIQTKKSDTGSSEVQIALFTAKINHLTSHFKTHVKDFHSKRGLLKMISKRRKLLDYLKRTSIDRYKKILKELNLRK